MRSYQRIIGLTAIAALGVGTSVAIGAGGDDGGVQACASQATGTIHKSEGGKCAPGQFAITISGEAFKQRPNQTLTINGVAFRTGTLPNTITINGTAFQTGTLPNSITINGVAIQSGTLPNSLTINGTAVREGAQGPKGDKGDPGSAAPGPAPVEAPDVAVRGGAGPTKLASVDISAPANHRILLAGGFDAVCGPCGDNVVPAWGLALKGATKALVQRHTTALGAKITDPQGTSFSEIVVNPAVCGPCTYNLMLAVPRRIGGSVNDAWITNTSAIRMSAVDLGPVGP